MNIKRPSPAGLRASNALLIPIAQPESAGPSGLEKKGCWLVPGPHSPVWPLLLLFLEVVVVDVASVDAVLVAVVEIHWRGHVVDLVVPHFDETAALVEVNAARPSWIVVDVIAFDHRARHVA